MADDVTIDTSELDRLVVDLTNAPVSIARQVRSALQVNAQHVKESWREKLAGNAYAPRVPFSITYDTKISDDGIEVEIGAQKGTGRQGGVALLLEYGAPRRGLAPRGYGLAALQENLEDLERGISRALGSALQDNDL